MARQNAVIGAKEFASESRRWYRQIGEHRYRITVTWKLENKQRVVVMQAERYVAWAKPWVRVHSITLPAKES
jgi:hypothetical protein